ncbi:hypothetical protein CEE37_12970 [candidate division LCP-89 bacterium B3_LCP]|uniref:Uncharacterized protein n=1 Tax=candidate division LCP-89 bacterium B3_LCP TaxID=2012998 RepID=A0A532UU10_UNCL8|nr:MAG: hypothetical protein CEE37_12970 [candidate division LCP-89 bacterium B3_LCP]
MSNYLMYEKEEGLAAYLQYLPTILNRRHNNCNCRDCDFDFLIIEGIKHVHHLFYSEIILLKHNKQTAAELMIRPIAEMTIDLMFIGLNINKYLPLYLAFDVNRHIFFYEEILAGRSNIELSRQEKEKLEADIANSKERLRKESLPFYSRSQWINITLPDQLSQLIKSEKYPFLFSSNYKNRIKLLHLLTHSSAFQLSRREGYNIQFYKSDEPIKLTIDWLMYLLEFVKIRFNKNSIETDIKKYHKMFYPEKYTISP